MWAGPAAALAVLLGLLPTRGPRAAGGAAVPRRCGWPRRVVAWWLSRPVVPRRLALGEAEDAAQLRRVARRTWRYFDRFVSAEDHWLPPDNVQEMPELRIAHRTSPDQHRHGAALDARRPRPGLPAHRRARRPRSRRRSRTVESLERHEGHLLNWYDTTSLAPLAPRYVSTVDSGNLAAR